MLGHLLTRALDHGIRIRTRRRQLIETDTELCWRAADDGAQSLHEGHTSRGRGGAARVIASADSTAISTLPVGGTPAAAGCGDLGDTAR